MNKEEMLITLENIQRKMGDAKIDEYELENRVEILENIFKLRERTEADIKYLTEKLSNDDNYVDRTPALYDESRRFNLEDYLAARQNDEQANLDDIARYESLLEQLQNNIDAQEAESKRVVETLNAELAEQGADLRDSEDMEDEEFNELRESINYNTMLRDAYSENITESRNVLTRYQEKIDNLKAQTEDLVAAREEAETILANFDEEQANRSNIDLAAKRSDKRKLRVYKKNLKSYEASEKMVSYDHEKAMAEIIEAYKNDEITQEEVVERVKEVRQYVVDDFLDEDLANRYNDSEMANEIEENKKAQEACNEEIARLENKLANDENYGVSAFIVERNNRQLKKLDAKISKVDEQIRLYNTEMEAMQQEVETSDELIQEAEQDKKDLQKQIRRLGVSITPELEEELLAKIASKDADIAYLQSVKLDSSRTIEHNATELSFLTSKQNRYTDLRTKLAETLDKRNTIDVSAKRLDEQELAKLKAGLDALKRREKIVGVSLYEDFDNIINGKTSTVDVSEKPETTELTDDENKELADFINNLESTPAVKNTDNAAEPTEKDDSTDPLGLGDTRGHKFKDNGENEKLSKKAKSKGFIGFLKKWWKIVTAAVALILLVTGLKACSANDINNKMIDIQENPTKYENMTEDELKDNIEDDLGISTPTEKVDEEEIVVSKKSNEEIAQEVIRGDWGNGKDRIDRLTAAGYDAEAIQDIVDKLFGQTNKPETANPETMESEVIAPVPTTDPIITDNNITMEEQKEILENQGIHESVDVPPTTVVDKPVYDYDINDEGSYGEFHEDENSTGTTTPGETTPGGSTTDDDWGEFHEDDVVNPSTPSEEKPAEDVKPDESIEESDSLNLTVNNGESFTIDLGNEKYELNNSDREATEDASSFIELDDTKNLIEDENGAVNLEIGGDTAQQLKRDEQLTAEKLQQMRDELAAQLGQSTLTQEEVDQANADYQESAKSR